MAVIVAPVLIAVAIGLHAHHAFASEPAVTARPVSEFLDSLGACTHIGQGVDDAARCATALDYAGIRNVRDDGSARHVKDWIAMHKSAGIRTVLTRSGPDDAAMLELTNISKQLAASGALLAMEGPNEPNNWAVAFENQKSDGKKSFLPLARWQQAFYAKVKADPVLKNYPVFHSSEAGGSEPDNVGMQYLTIPQAAGTLMPAGTKYADFANVHNYICRQPKIIDNMAWLNADPLFRGWPDGMYAEYGKTWHKHFTGYGDADLAKLPRVTTETGWGTGPKELTQEQQARLYLNMYLDQFKQGYKYTFVYLLRDGFGGDANFGMFTNNYRPKKSGQYLHNLTTILSDHAPPASSGKFGYTVVDQPANVHDLLLDKRSGTFDLVVWGERVDGTCTITVRFAEPITGKLYDPTTGVAPQQSLDHTTTLSLKLGDHPVIFEFSK